MVRHSCAWCMPRVKGQPVQFENDEQGNASCADLLEIPIDCAYPAWNNICWACNSKARPIRPLVLKALLFAQAESSVLHSDREIRHQITSERIMLVQT
jgi:hypothetical protein